MGFALFLFFGWFCLLWVSLCAALSKKNSDHKKEKERKLAMMKEFPELAKEIWQSIEDQETRHHGQMTKLSSDMSAAFNQMGDGFKPKPKSRHAGAIIRGGLSLANKIVDKGAKR